MRFYNPLTKEIKEKTELQNQYNASIAEDTEVVELSNDTWYPIDESNPIPNDFNYDTQNLIGTHVIKDNNKYYLKYIVTDKSQEQIESEQIEQETSEIDNILIELKSSYTQAQMIGDTETMEEISNTTKELLGLTEENTNGTEE